MMMAGCINIFWSLICLVFRITCNTNKIKFDLLAHGFMWSETACSMLIIDALESAMQTSLFLQYKTKPKTFKPHAVRDESICGGCTPEKPFPPLHLLSFPPFPLSSCPSPALFERD